MKDALGKELQVGDKVAYVHRWGSIIEIDEREIKEIGERFLNLGNATNVNPKNVVKIYGN